MFKKDRISLVIPCYNEAAGLEKILKRRPAFIDEVIVVDNNSTDKTAEVAAALGARVVFEARRGYGAAYQAGFFRASGDIIVTMDGDDSYPIEEIERLLGVFSDQRADFISGARFPLKRSGSMKLINKFGNAVLTALFFLVTAKRLKDSQSGLWVFRRELLDGMNLESVGMALSEEIKMEALLSGEIKFLEVPIDYADRVGDVKLRKWRDGLENLVFLFRKRAEIFFRGAKAAKRVRWLGFILAACFFTGFFYFLLFGAAGFLGLFLSIILAGVLYFSGRLINKIIYGRDSVFF